MSAASLADTLSSFLSSIVGVLSSVATAIADNADVIATVMIVGALTFIVIRYGTRIMNSITGWFRGLF